MRLDRLLSEMTGDSRSEIKKKCRKGAVSVNGASVRDSGLHVDPDRDEVVYDGQPVSYVRNRYFMMNKPKGVVTAQKDSRFRTVMELFQEEMPQVQGRGLFPAGRLDLDTEGLLLITDDGELSHRLLSPSRHVDKVYKVRVHGVLVTADADAFAEGMDIGEKKKTRPAELVIIRSGFPDETGQVCSLAEVTLSEGKYHQVKRMFQKIGKPVLELKRLSFGPLRLDENLEPGEVRALSEAETAALRDAAHL